MPAVPNYEPSKKIGPNIKELNRLRKAKADREAEKKKAKLDKWREEYWANNPIYKFPHPN